MKMRVARGLGLAWVGLSLATSTACSDGRDSVGDQGGDGTVDVTGGATVSGTVSGTIGGTGSTGSSMGNTFGASNGTTTGSTTDSAIGSTGSGTSVASSSGNTRTGASPTASSTTAGSVTSTTGGQSFAPAQFPIGISDDKNYLVDASGAPFLIRGDSAWSILTELSKSDALKYLDSRQALGFNTVLTTLVEANFSSHDPKWRNAEGEVPFDDPNDFSATNDAYFEHVDWFLAEAESRGVLVLLAPAYLGYGCGSEGWCSAMQANGVDKLRQYGEYLGTRYKDTKNIIWVQGGDHTPSSSEMTLVSAVAEGIRDAEGDVHLDVAHWATETSGFEGPSAAWLQVDTTYTYSAPQVYQKTLSDRARDVGRRPFFFFEGMYENEHSVSGLALRTQMYQPVLSGGSGFLFGNFPIWPLWTNQSGWNWQFDDGKYPGGWPSALEGNGSLLASIAFSFFAGVPWHTLAPDTEHQVLIDGYGGGEVFALCAADQAGTIAVTYATGALDMQFDLAKFAGPVTATWFDPSSGLYMSAGDGWANTGVQDVSTPGANGERAQDWVLVLKVE